MGFGGLGGFWGWLSGFWGWLGGFRDGMVSDLVIGSGWFEWVSEVFRSVLK